MGIMASINPSVIGSVEVTIGSSDVEGNIVDAYIGIESLWHIQ